MRVFVAADAVTFVALIAAALIARSGDWRAPGDPSAGVGFAVFLTGLLIAASAALVLGKRARWSYALAAVCALGFVAAALIEWRALGAAGLAPGNSRFADFFYLITGYHMAHVAAGAAVLVKFAARRSQTTITSGQAVALGWYWHFVDALWIAIFATLY
jgi:cytochrome c oxidase subunit 3